MLFGENLGRRHDRRLESVPGHHRHGEKGDHGLSAADITLEHNGAVFAFATEANRDAFAAEPARFVPQSDGHCAYGVAGGYKVPANPTLWRIVDDKLFLNINRRVARKWERDISGYEQTAMDKWPDLEPRPASTDDVPQFSATGPLVN